MELIGILVQIKTCGRADHSETVKIHENMVDDGKMSYKAHIAKRGIDR